VLRFRKRSIQTRSSFPAPYPPVEEYPSPPTHACSCVRPCGMFMHAFLRMWVYVFGRECAGCWCWSVRVLVYVHVHVHVHLHA